MMSKLPEAANCDVAVLRFEVTEHVADLVGGRVLQTEHARHVAIFAGRGLSRVVRRRGLRRDAARLDDLQEAPVRNDGEPVRLEDRQERLIRLADRHFLRRINRCFDVADFAAKNEAFARELANDAYELGEIRVFERERYFVIGIARFVFDALFELRERRRVALRFSAGARRALTTTRAAALLRLRRVARRSSSRTAASSTAALRGRRWRSARISSRRRGGRGDGWHALDRALREEHGRIRTHERGDGDERKRGCAHDQFLFGLTVARAPGMRGLATGVVA